jgi:very-short-patch-repair endonuclease
MKKYIKPTTPRKATTNQPIKGVTTNTKKNTATKTKKGPEEAKQRVYKSQNVVPTKDSTIKDGFIRKNDTPKERKHPEYGTSKLEDKFAKNFLDKLGIRYETQFKAESIGRYYDFYLPDYQVLIEIDGDYYHSYNLVYEQMSPMQKKNKRVDEQKNKWALHHKIPLIRIWEHDINESPKKVMEVLKTELSKFGEQYKKELDKKLRPKKNDK